MEEIEKLRIRVEKDPNSRLFLPLAEEYRKSGLLDEAISVILGGLERQPGYTSARVALGRMYLEKNMIDEAKSEFEAVVRAIPDNLFAHRKLADIYKDSGETEKATAEYETVLRLNPLDDDAKMCLMEISGSVPDEELPAFGEVEIEKAPEESAGGLPDEIAGAVAAESEDFEEFKNSFSGIGMEDSESTEDVLEIPENQVLELSEESPFENIFQGTEAESPEEVHVPEAHTFSADSGGAAGLSMADSFILSGNYYKALETYKEVLTGDPDNKQVLQRIVELRALMKLTGKDGEALIARLEAFLDAIKRGFPKRL
jgi:tetratricopeptide (TPR) repeat protein